MDTFVQHAAEFEQRIGIRRGFFNTLIQEDDWSFVIKLHAFIETCLTHAICASLGRLELENIIARLDTSNSQSGKIAFAKALGLLNKSQRRYVSRLSQLRNELVHDARAVDFCLDKYLSKLTDEQRYEFCVSLSLDGMFAPHSGPNEIRIISFVNEVPKFGIAYAALTVIAKLFTHTCIGDFDKEMTRLGKAIFERMS